MKMIEAKKVVPLIRLILFDNPNIEKICKGMQDVVNIHTIEAEPVRHGRWEDSTDEWFGTDVYTCSKCRESYVLVDGTPKENLWHYCPNCGADMRGEEVGNENMESEE